MDKWTLNGIFAVKEGTNRIFLTFEAGPGPAVNLYLSPETSMETARQLAKALNGSVAEVVVDHSYSSATKLGIESGPAGYGPLR